MGLEPVHQCRSVILCRPPLRIRTRYLYTFYNDKYLELAQHHNLVNFLRLNCVLVIGKRGQMPFQIWFIGHESERWTQVAHIARFYSSTTTCVYNRPGLQSRAWRKTRTAISRNDSCKIAVCPHTVSVRCNGTDSAPVRRNLCPWSL